METSNTVWTPPTNRRQFKYRIFSELARIISDLSTCSRLHVGTIVTDKYLEQIYSIGYNGNAAGAPNQCDSDEPGNCGCIHSEANALIKCGAGDKEKIMFVTTRPCLRCAKLIVNSGFSKVVYQDEYRTNKEEVEVLFKIANIELILN